MTGDNTLTKQSNSDVFTWQRFTEITAWNTEILTNIQVLKSCGNPKFLQSFGQIAWIFPETLELRQGREAPCKVILIF